MQAFTDKLIVACIEKLEVRFTNHTSSPGTLCGTVDMDSRQRTATLECRRPVQARFAMISTISGEPSSICAFKAVTVPEYHRTLEKALALAAQVPDIAPGECPSHDNLITTISLCSQNLEMCR